MYTSIQTLYSGLYIDSASFALHDWGVWDLPRLSGSVDGGHSRTLSVVSTCLCVFSFYLLIKYHIPCHQLF